MKLKVVTKKAAQTAPAKQNRTKQATSVAKGAKVKTSKVGQMVSNLYRQLRETPLNLCNCRKQDFTKQVISEGRLAKTLPESVVVVQGAHGTTVSTLRVDTKRGLADLDDGRVFDLTGLKHVQVLAPKQAAALVKTKGRPVNATIGKSKLASVGHLMGDVSKMYVVFLTASREFKTLETKALPKGRNKNATFALGK